MAITPLELYPPQPVTTRAQGVSIAYDEVNQRIAYVLGRSVFVKPLDYTANVRGFQFTKHVAPTTAVAFSHNGNYLASGDQLGNVKIWDTSVVPGKDPLSEPPYVKSEFPVLNGAIKAIVWDSDNLRIVAVGEGKERYGHCFSWDSGNSVGEIQGHSDTINAVDIKSQRPFRVATVSNDKSMVFLTGPPFKFDKSVRDHSNVVRDVKFSPDGKYLVTVGSDRLIAVYDGKTADLVTKLENAHEGGIFGISWYKDSSKFVTCSADNTIKVWDPSLTALKTLRIDGNVSIDNQLLGVVVTKTGLVSVSTNGNLNYYIDDTVKVIRGHQSGIISVAIVDKFVVSGGANGTLLRWEINNDHRLGPEPTVIGDGHSNYVCDIIYHHEYLITAGWDDKLKVWKQFELDREIELPYQPKKLSINGDTINVLFENTIQTYSIGEFKLINEQKLKYDTNDIDIISDKLLCTNLSDNKLEELDIELHGHKSLDAIRGQPSLVRVSPDSNYIALGDSTGKLVIYNSDYTIKTSRWSHQTSKIMDAKWSADSKFLLTAGLDSGIYIYSVAKVTKVIKYPLAHQGGITRVEWLSYGTTSIILTTGHDGAIKLWQVNLNGF